MSPRVTSPRAISSGADTFDYRNYSGKMELFLDRDKESSL